MEVKFYLCLTCGNILCSVVDSGVTPKCCGSNMELLEVKTRDNGIEKHLPVAEWLDDHTLRVKVGSQPHPCSQEHHIVMIALEMKDGICIKKLDHSHCTAPEAVFHCRKEEVRGVFAYCNLHGLWHQPLEGEK